MKIKYMGRAYNMQHTHRYIYDKTTQNPTHIKIPVYGHHSPEDETFYIDVETMRAVFEESIKHLVNARWKVKPLHPASHLKINNLYTGGDIRGADITPDTKWGDLDPQLKTLDKGGI